MRTRNVILFNAVLLMGLFSPNAFATERVTTPLHAVIEFVVGALGLDKSESVSVVHSDDDEAGGYVNPTG